MLNNKRNKRNKRNNRNNHNDHNNHNNNHNNKDNHDNYFRVVIDKQAFNRLLNKFSGHAGDHYRNLWMGYQVNDDTLDNNKICLEIPVLPDIPIRYCYHRTVLQELNAEYLDHPTGYNWFSEDLVLIAINDYSRCEDLVYPSTGPGTRWLKTLLDSSVPIESNDAIDMVERAFPRMNPHDIISAGRNKVSRSTSVAVMEITGSYQTGYLNQLAGEGLIKLLFREGL